MVALAVPPYQETDLDEFTQQLFSARWTQLPQARRLCGRQAHPRHLTELSPSSYREILSGGFG